MDGKDGLGEVSKSRGGSSHDFSHMQNYGGCESQRGGDEDERTRRKELI